MKLPLKWLKEYVDFNVTPEKFVELMMWRGFEVADIEDEMPGITNVAVGRIEALSKHPNADKLQICSINVGKEENVCIVTGATNVYEGALVPVALDGAHLAGDIVIHPTNMRGVESLGMLCSGKELGLTEADYPGAEVYGIMLLQGEHPLGQSIQEAVGLDDLVFDIELTPNRADCQSIIGICREAAAALGQKFREPEIKEIKGAGNSADYASVEVLDTDLPEVHCKGSYRHQHCAFTGVAAEAPAQRWPSSHKQYSGYYKLRNGGVRPSYARVRSLLHNRRPYHSAPGQGRGEGSYP